MRKRASGVCKVAEVRDCQRITGCWGILYCNMVDMITLLKYPFCFREFLAFHSQLIYNLYFCSFHRKSVADLERNVDMCAQCVVGIWKTGGHLICIHAYILIRTSTFVLHVLSLLKLQKSSPTISVFNINAKSMF